MVKSVFALRKAVLLQNKKIDPQQLTGEVSDSPFCPSQNVKGKQNACTLLAVLPEFQAIAFKFMAALHF